MDFIEFAKISRLSRPCVITEKIDGTNASITISENGDFLIGSRTRWITPNEDNHGFAKWAMANKEELLRLGVGTHYGEWWGLGIQRNYGMKEKHFSLFNTARWSEASVRPTCCNIVPVLYEGTFDTSAVTDCLDHLRSHGSVVAPGFMKPEGVVVWHEAARMYFKKTLEKDESPKNQV